MTRTRFHRLPAQGRAMSGTALEVLEVDVTAQPEGQRGRRGRVLRRFMRHRLAMAGLVVMLVLVLATILAPLISPRKPLTIELQQRSGTAAPYRHLAGSDDLVW